MMVMFFEAGSKFIKVSTARVHSWYTAFGWRKKFTRKNVSTNISKDVVGGRMHASVSIKKESCKPKTLSEC